jgi:hypothetical protein
MKIKVQTKWPGAVVLSIAAAALALPETARAQLASANTPQGNFNVPFYFANSLQTLPDTPASTLLLPYFEVDLSNPTGMNTIFSVNNMGGTLLINNGVTNQGAIATLAHVVIWSDLGVPVFNFNVYLTGYDVARVDMRSLLNGVLPQSASAGQDPTDQLSPKGIHSQDINFASCTKPLNYIPPVNSYPVLPPGLMTANQIDNLQKSLTGSASTNVGGMCAGLNHNDNIARGYVTIDTVNNCTARFPGDVGYLAASGSGDTTDQVQFTGEVFYVDQLHAIARGDNLVHIHSDPTDPLTSTSGNYTFYARYDNFTAVDHRQALPTNFGAHFVNGNFTGAPIFTSSSPAWGMPPASPPAGSTSLIVWRDTKIAQQYFTCGNNPSWYPMAQETLVAFDEQEHIQLVPNTQGPPFNFAAGFPAATQVVLVGGSSLPVSFTAGWLYLGLNATVTGVTKPTSDPAAAQAWVQIIEQNGSQIFNLIHRAQQLDSGKLPAHVTP